MVCLSVLVFEHPRRGRAKNSEDLVGISLAQTSVGFGKHCRMSLDCFGEFMDTHVPNCALLYKIQAMICLFCLSKCFYSHSQQCVVNAGSGVCPDAIIQPAGLNSVTLVSSSYENGITTMAYRRPLDTGMSYKGNRFK